MSMSVQTDSDEEHSVMSEINTTPLVDIMLVLLIIFLITIPIITKTVKLQLPKATNIPTVTKPENITISVDQGGNIYWNGGSRCGSRCADQQGAGRSGQGAAARGAYPR